MLFLLLSWWFLLPSSCKGDEYFAVNSSSMQTCYRHGQNFQPCNTLEYYSSIFRNQSDMNITINLLDDTYEMSVDSNFSLTGELVKIRPWNSDSLATLSCVDHNIHIHCHDVDIFIIQSVQFVQCGRSDLPVILAAEGYNTSSRVQMLNLIFIGSRHISFQILSNITELEIANCLFTESESATILINSTILNAQIMNTSFIRNGARSFLFQDSSFMSNLILQNCKFLNNTSQDLQSNILLSLLNKVTIISSRFIGNTPNGAAQVEYIHDIIVNDTIFYNNEATVGGALHVSSAEKSNILIVNSSFMENRGNYSGGALYIENFRGSGTLFILDDVKNHVNITYCTFKQNSALHGDGGGGAVNVILARTFINHCTFISNHAGVDGRRLQILANFEVVVYSYGGAIYSTGGALSVTSCEFFNNRAQSGGAVYSRRNTSYIIAHNSGLQTLMLKVLFSNNTAEDEGGAIYFSGSLLNMTLCDFSRNTAQRGGALYTIENTHITRTNFNNNEGEITGGAVDIVRLLNKIHIYGSLFINNSASQGGASNIQFVFESHVNNICNSCASLNNIPVTIMNCSFSNNRVSSTKGEGGAISVRSNAHTGLILKYKYDGCSILNCTYQRNKAMHGGGIYSKLSSIVLANTIFQENVAELKGGGIFIEKSKLYFCGNNTFKRNKVVSSKGTGGAMHVKHVEWECTENSCPVSWANTSTLFFKDNVASIGSMLYGGMLDRCSYLPGNSLMSALSRLHTAGEYDLHSYNITSRKTQFCFCSACELRSMDISLYSGQSFTVSVVCLDQLQQPVNNCEVKSEYISMADVFLGQGENKRLISDCQNLTYHSLSKQTGVAILNITSYDIICKGFNWSTLVVNVTIKPCPLGFELIKRECLCDTRLYHSFINLKCTISNESIVLTRNEWFSYEQQHLRTHDNCPLNYCHKGKKYISPENPDFQCAHNRGGILCGGCVANYSVVLGSWKCMDCSHLSRYNFIWLTVLLALAGVVLVVFLLLVKITVSSGTTNGLIFYANILSFIGLLDYRTCTIHPLLRIFISWINLDLGIEVCYYLGMDVYQKTWLQFIFPFYIWFLVGVIILFCHYSSKVMKLMGLRNIEVLATLFLLSYAKLLKTIVTTFSFTDIMVAQAENVSDPLLPTRVWVYDGSIKYFGDKHLPLFIVSLLFLLLLFLPYTTLLLLGQYLYLLPNKKFFKVFRSTALTTIMDAYHAPYNKRFRNWTGLSLLIRCFLFTMFAVSHTIQANVFWTTLSIMFLFSLRLFAGGRVYRSKVVNLLEIFYLLNLMVLMVLVYKENHFCKSLTISVSLSTITFGLIIIFHIAQVIKKGILYKSFMTTIASINIKRSKPADRTCTSNDEEEQSVSYVELRETLIDS